MALKAHLDKPAVSAAPAIDARRHPRRALRLETSGTLPEGIEATIPGDGHPSRAGNTWYAEQLVAELPGLVEGL